jgi:hypothetical protein
LGVRRRARCAGYGFLGAGTLTLIPKPTTPATTTAPAVKRAANTVRPQTSEERRRAQRVLLRIPILIHIAGRAKPIEGATHTVSATGAMILLAEGLAAGTKLTIENPRAQKKVEAHVVRPAQMNPEGSLVPIEFTSPSPQFWGIFFPPVTN